MLAVPPRTHWVHKFLTKWLKLKRMMAGYVMRLCSRKVVEVSRSYDAKAPVQGLQVLKERHPPRPVAEFVGIEKEPPNVVVSL